MIALDLGLFAASATKFADGGWLPVTIANVLVAIFNTWRRRRLIVTGRAAAEAMPTELFLNSVVKVHRVDATGIYLVSNHEGIPPALLHNLKFDLVLHRKSISSRSRPR